jgi:hypothetical protein
MTSYSDWTTFCPGDDFSRASAAPTQLIPTCSSQRSRHSVRRCCHTVDVRLRHSRCSNMGLQHHSTTGSWRRMLGKKSHSALDRTRCVVRRRSQGMKYTETYTTSLARSLVEG